MTDFSLGIKKLRAEVISPVERLYLEVICVLGERCPGMLIVFNKTSLDLS